MRKPQLVGMVLILMSLWGSGHGMAQRLTGPLTMLTRQFQSARELPAGSRPQPPDVPLDGLRGLSLETIRSALGPPNYHNAGSLKCSAEFCWSYIYGPGEAPLPPPVKRSDGTVEIVVRTGGPWLLVLGSTRDKLITVRWLGQR